MYLYTERTPLKKQTADNKSKIIQRVCYWPLQAGTSNVINNIPQTNQPPARTRYLKREGDENNRMYNTPDLAKTAARVDAQWQEANGLTIRNPAVPLNGAGVYDYNMM